ncbi:phospholipase A [Thiocystis violacea]|uniref:phospholipase A n=1 Tax=Thiocystis violacea TaxID=13725 RepID=UPI00190503BD|nr:phospholipase A [Thiocystis violacea]MBK1722967.1 hypothetical protein [Thiocystis violacea]
MIHPPNTRIALAAPLLCLPLTSLATESDLSASLARCAQVEDSTQRLSCFDALSAAKTSSSAALTLAPAPANTSASAAPPTAPMTAEAAPRAQSAGMQLDEGDKRQALGVRLYRPNYLLPVTYNDNPNRNLPAEETIDIPFLGDALDKVEMKFQISFEVPVWTDILDQPLDLYFAYTQLAFFQAYNREYSSPFRETNYEPEVGFNWQPDVSAFGWQLRSARAMLNHQSNGRSEPLSRSWNRLIGQLEANRGDLTLGLRLWSPLETSPSDNPDIYDYLGYGELHAAYDLKKHHFGVMFRNPAHPTVQLDWTYPLGDTIRFYVQYFNGYGESLLDYNHSVNRIGVGFLVNEWP